MPRYALFAGAVALCGLPLYIHLPAFLASEYGITLEALGVLLLMLRLFDFVQDPLLGWLLSKQAHRLNALALFACFVLVLGDLGLFALSATFPPLQAGRGAGWGSGLLVGLYCCGAVPC